MNIFFSRLRKLKINKIQSPFSVYSNQHHTIKEIINGKEYTYDHNIQKYEPIIQAFIQKRWTKKEEIPTKIYIVDPLSSVEESLALQSLIPLDRLLDISRLQRMNESDEFNSQYLISICCEEYFKPLCDQYLNKVLINGRVPPMQDISEYNKIREQVMELYHRFFYGDFLSGLEEEVEIKYLALKQRKFFRYQTYKKPVDKCIWTYSQQKRVEIIINWRARDTDMFDDFRPFYKPLKIGEKIDYVNSILRINQDGWIKRQFFNWFDRKRFTSSRKRTDWIVSYLFTRTMLYANSTEFIKILNIPPDFHIEHSVINIHIWLLMDRLKKIDSPESRYTYKILDQCCNKYTQQEIGKIHLRKKNDFIKDVDSYMKISRQYLDYHFNRNSKTFKNHYYKLDALVWSLVFFEKVPRYSEQVYLMAEYIKANYDYISKLPFSKFEDADIQFDVYKVSLNYKDKLLAMNPPLEESEFIKQFYSDEKKKKYYYSYDEDQTFQMPLEIPWLFTDSVLTKRVDKLNLTLSYTYKKFLNLQTYDHFSSFEEQKKDLEKQNKYIWTQQNIHPPTDIDLMKKTIQDRRISQR